MQLKYSGKEVSTISKEAIEIFLQFGAVVFMMNKLSDKNKFLINNTYVIANFVIAFLWLVNMVDMIVIYSFVSFTLNSISGLTTIYLCVMTIMCYVSRNKMDGYYKWLTYLCYFSIAISCFWFFNDIINAADMIKRDGGSLFHWACGLCTVSFRLLVGLYIVSCGLNKPNDKIVK